MARGLGVYIDRWVESLELSKAGGQKEEDWINVWFAALIHVSRPSRKDCKYDADNLNSLQIFVSDYHLFSSHSLSCRSYSACFCLPLPSARYDVGVTLHNAYERVSQPSRNYSAEEAKASKIPKHLTKLIVRFYKS